MKTYLSIGLLLAVATQASGFGLVSNMMSNPATVLSAARYMTEIIMRNMAQKRTNNIACVEHVSRSAVTFFNEASASLQLGRLLQITMRRATALTSADSSAAVPLDVFCRIVRVPRLRAASTTFVSRLTCLGEGAVDDTDRLFRSLVHTIEHVCRDGGRDATQFMADARQCRRLDADHEQQMEQIKSLRRGRRSATIAAAAITTAATASNGSSSSSNSTDGSQPQATEAPPADGTTGSAGAPDTTPAPSTVYSTLQACLDDVNQLLPAGARITQREELSDVLLTLPALLPRLLQRDGLPQFCPALLKAGDCAHLALIDCPPRTQKAMARFFQSTLRDILCYNIPSDDVLAELIWSSQVKEWYFGL